MAHREEASGRGPDRMDEHDEGFTADGEARYAGRRLDGRALGIGLLIGAALGAGAALLLAPASGEDTRRHLRRGARRLYARSSEAVADLRDDADRAARRLARRAQRNFASSSMA